MIPFAFENKEKPFAERTLYERALTCEKYKIRKARDEYICCLCKKVIPYGERHHSNGSPDRRAHIACAIKKSI